MTVIMRSGQQQDPPETSQPPQESSSTSSATNTAPLPSTSCSSASTVNLNKTSSGRQQAPEERAHKSLASPSGDSPSSSSLKNMEESGSSATSETIVDEEMNEDEEPDFPIHELNKLDDMINKPRWVIPVLPKGELEILLEASIDLCKKGLDVRSEPCQRFIRDGLTISFTKILTDEAVSGWKHEIHKCILHNCERLIELIVLKMHSDWFPLLDLLAIVFFPNNKFHSFTATRTEISTRLPDEEVFAKSSDPRNPRGWLVELINKFGKLGGFNLLLERFQDGPPLTVPLIAALLKPFGLCYELLTPQTVEKYFLPIIKTVPSFLEKLTDEELKKEAKNETKNDALSGIVKALKSLASRVPDQEETIKELEIFRLKTILRLLQISSFNGKMNALNEVNKVITSVSYYSHRHPGGGGISGVDEEEWLNAEKMAEWLKENKVLQIVLRDSLHQPQYVEKLEKIIRFIIKEKALTLEDLDDIWAAQSGKHEAIVKNVHDLLAKLAWDFTPEQLDHLFECFQSSWTNATKKQREKLLELIRRLAEDDKEGVMAHKVLNLLWNLAHSYDVPNDIMDQALAAHVKILDYSCSQDRDNQKTEWLDKCVEELSKPNGGYWVLPALKQIREICCLYNEAPQNFVGASTALQQGPVPHHQRITQLVYRHEVITKLQNQHSLVVLVSENLSNYMNRIRAAAKQGKNFSNPNEVSGSRFSHVQEVHERLNFLRFLLKDGQLWLCSPQAKQIWKCLAENAVYEEDREACFRWFSQLMSDEPDLDPDINRNFFENNILQLDPSLVNESGIECFDRFFKAVNVKEGKLVAKRRYFQMEDYELIGIDYLWRIILQGNDEVANKAIDLLKETLTNLGPNLQSKQIELHEDFINSCMDRLKASYDTISILEKDNTAEFRVRQEMVKMTRVLNALYEYVNQCDIDYGEERCILPMSRSFRGKNLLLIIRFPNHGRHLDDIEIWTHTNDTLYSIRQQILTKIKANNSTMKVDLYINGDLLDPNDKKLVLHLPLKDKMLLSAKLYQVNSNMPSSPDSSSDSSTSSPQHPFIGPNKEAESSLPGVIMSNQPQYAQFLFQLADIGMSLNYPPLLESAMALLKIMPADVHMIEHIKSLCNTSSASPEEQFMKFDEKFFGNSPTKVVYSLGIIYSLLLPASNHLSEDAQEFQCNFISSGCGLKIIELLTKNNFLSKADDFSKMCAYLIVLKISKLTMTTIAHCILLSENIQDPKLMAVLKESIQFVPNQSSECMTRTVAQRIARILCSEEKIKSFINTINYRPDKSTINSVIELAWSAATGNKNALQATIEELHKMISEETAEEPSGDVYEMCKEALEVLTVMFMLSPETLDIMTKENTWQSFVIDLLLICKEKSIRITMMEQFALIATKCALSHEFLIKFIQLLHEHLRSKVPKDKNYQMSQEFFQLFCRLLNYASLTNCSLPNFKELLKYEINLLRNIRKLLVIDGLIEEIQLEGHLGVTKELVSFLNNEEKFEVGSDPNGVWGPEKRGMIKILIEEYIFPASRAMVLMLQQKNNNRTHIEEINPICSSPPTLTAAYDLLVALCTGCISNLKLTAEILIEMFYSTNDQLVEWEYFPPIGPRPPKGFVGLKNAGATCYMNSVLQQLYMIPEIREGILVVEGAAIDPNEDFSGEEKNDSILTIAVGEQNRSEEDKSAKAEIRKDYNIGVLKQIQAIFGHLLLSKLQYYVPKGFWRHFKLWGEPVNLREQHDALEFFNSLVDSIDEALKALRYKPIMSTVLGGTFADQKICKDCPHRYSREESFTTLNIDIRNHSNLLDSLEQYVKGDLLEGANAYHCEKCNRKVDTVKRLCIKKLPTVLAIQLKRFDYDWERESAIKFNDYFEFPRVFDMEPYTVRGLAKIEGEIIDDDLVLCDDETFNGVGVCTKYELTGIVVHSGQASGGHYYSYILYKNSDGQKRWYKFDDNDVSDCKLDDDEEMRVQCFGGEYMGEVFDHLLKRMSCRRQKRWWNAYILFYRRIDTEENLLAKRLNELVIMESKTKEARLIKMPVSIERSVQRQNIKFMHTKNQFSFEYFHFMKKLINCNGNFLLVKENVNSFSKTQIELSTLSTHLAAKFLFSTCFRTKKALRGSAVEWYEVLSVHLRVSQSIRSWFVTNVLLYHPHRFCEYLLECPSADVRSAFAKLIVFLAHYALQDGAQIELHSSTSHVNEVSAVSLSDRILQPVLELLRKEVSEYSRNLAQYFSLFCMYASIGNSERLQLLKLNVPALFMLVALDEGPGPPIKYQYADLSKLYQVVSLLVRCCDVSSKTRSSVGNARPLPNPLINEDCSEYLISIQPQVADILLNKTNYIKKIIEETNSAEDTIKLLKFCSWENPQVSSVVLNELLWQIAYSYAYELRPHLDMLLHILLLEDSWQQHRIIDALKGANEDREALFDTIHRNKTHYQKRAYQCIKCLVTLFTNCQTALQILTGNTELRRKWTGAVAWLNDELERRPYATTQYAYNNWSPPAQSNETSNGYYLERSHSAKMTLAKALELCPAEEQSEDMNEELELPEVPESPPSEAAGDEICTRGVSLDCDNKNQIGPMWGSTRKRFNVINENECKYPVVPMTQSQDSPPSQDLRLSSAALSRDRLLAMKRGNKTGQESPTMVPKNIYWNTIDPSSETQQLLPGKQEDQEDVEKNQNKEGSENN